MEVGPLIPLCEVFKHTVFQKVFSLDLFLTGKFMPEVFELKLEYIR